jgi:hypothetical protein
MECVQLGIAAFADAKVMLAIFGPLAAAISIWAIVKYGM